MLHLITCHGRIMPHLAELFFAKCLHVGEDVPGRGHLCHTDSFLVDYL